MSAADIVCGVLPSFLEGPVQKRVIELGKNYVSPSGFLYSDGLDELAKKHGVTAVFDMGVAPSNIARAFIRGCGEVVFGAMVVGISRGSFEKESLAFLYRM